ncbi:sigma-54-dependent Fis family transcriptional regulator [Bacillus sp. V5-8f]|uniref:sigma-54 interaction domain-containing protein n=1 Tax=Bacillus sp. V5-8f TaxID=2053044 RepID=UPI000C786240|nr:sigma 54-interacting transcriptional regulator [Bacillus sp. V5-8f]PLT35559.1 Fis family transcriptional regulator [Bacillus sp. V5-8f]
MVSSILEEFTIPAIVLSDDDSLIDSNQGFRNLLDHQPLPHSKIQHVVSEWKYLNKDKAAIVTIGTRKFAFFKNKGKNEAAHSTIYIGVETEFLDDLAKHVRSLEKQKRAYDAIIENSYDGIYITDREGITIRTNSAIERITGIPKEYYVGKSVDQLIKRGILSSSVTHKVVKQRRTVSLVQPNYAGKETLITGSPVFNEEGEIERIVTNIRDLSDLNDLMRELKKANDLNNKYKKEIEKLKTAAPKDGIIFVSDKMRDIYHMIGRISDVDATVLLLGETGVGKDVIARNLYTRSNRSSKGEFIKINCGAIPPDLLESELFGYETGAFTGANRKGKPGMFEMADGGILFLDEIGELPLSLQVKLLRVLQEREIQRIGGTTPKKVDVRIVSATNRNLKEMVQNGEFREDLYYRLHVIPITIPPLRERKDDILPLADLFLQTMNQRYHYQKNFHPHLRDFFNHFDWPGNVRELQNLIERLVLTTPDNTITVDSLPEDYKEAYEIESGQSLDTLSLKEAVEQAERNVLVSAAQRYHTTYEIAEALDSSQATIVRKLKKYNIEVKEKTKL